MILIIAEGTDAPALWLQRRLSPLTAPVPVRRINPAQLFAGSRFSFHIDRKRTDISVTLQNGRAVSGERLTGVINRVVSVPQSLLAEMAKDDRAYTESEFQACLLGWLAALPCPVINRATPAALAGPWHGALAMRQLARRAGLPVGSGPATSRLVVFDGDVFPHVKDSRWRQALVRFSRGYGGRLIELHMARDGLMGAVPFADFRAGGPALVAALAAALAETAGKAAA